MRLKLMKILFHVRRLLILRSTQYLVSIIATAPSVFAIITIGAVAASADHVTLKAMGRGAASLMKIRARELTLLPTRPTGVKRVPIGLSAPLYAMLELGPKEHPSRFAMIIDAPDNSPSRLYVDSNGNGDFSDDPAPEWTHKPYRGPQNEALMMSVGGATVKVRYGAITIPMHVNLTRYDSTEPPRVPQFLPIYCTADYAMEGTVTLSDKPYHVWLTDALNRGDFRGSGIPGQLGIFLLIDVNRNGKIDARGETYDAAEPFNIGGTTYEVRNIGVDGANLEIVKSPVQVAEVLPPPDLRVGKSAVPFEATSTSGAIVRFPGDYKHKLVLLYFWATWCGDCGREVPFVTAAYKTYHPQGLEMLGISLDHPDQAGQLEAYTRARGMPWLQVYDGKGWEAAIAQLYFVTSTPTPLLVDGDTGAILAGAADLTGERLALTLDKELKRHASRGSIVSSDTP